MANLSLTRLLTELATTWWFRIEHFEERGGKQETGEESTTFSTSLWDEMNKLHQEVWEASAELKSEQAKFSRIQRYLERLMTKLMKAKGLIPPATNERHGNTPS
ncbi:MAG: hypothetical protein HY335_11215 [Deinococcus sp.]|nr:hypothetical protein [Deinococcus sp.]